MFLFVMGRQDVNCPRSMTQKSQLLQQGIVLGWLDADQLWVGSLTFGYQAIVLNLKTGNHTFPDNRPWAMGTSSVGT